MKKYSFNIMLVVLCVAMGFMSCKEKEGMEPVLTVSTSEIRFAPEGGVDTLTIECNDQWSISNSAYSWLQLSQTSGDNSTAAIQLAVTSANTTGANRSVILTISSPNGQTRRVSVSQATLIYPTYNTSPKAPDITGMSSTAVELVSKIGLGWNFGNALEAPNGEGDWSAPITRSYVEFVKNRGFNAIRIPCGWNFHVDNAKTAHIDPNWISRVKEVVGYCVENDMYVLLNIHWDGGWLEKNCTIAKKDSVNAKQKAFWEQIATAMRDFDEHLMFASANEPNADNSEQTGVLLSYHKTFIDAVRSTGGRNTYRTLVLQGHTDYMNPENFPADPTPNRLAFEWHNYTPSSFTILYNDRVDKGWDDVRFYWGEGNYSSIEPDRNCTYGFESDLLDGYNQIKTRFIDKGVPCLMGEYSTQRWTEERNKFVPKEMDKHNKSVDDWITFNTRQCKAIGAAPFYWETGGIIDRTNNVILDQRSLDAIIAGSK